jgi:hypothetical protein
MAHHDRLMCNFTSNQLLKVPCVHVAHPVAPVMFALMQALMDLASFSMVNQLIQPRSSAPAGHTPADGPSRVSAQW